MLINSYSHNCIEAGCDEAGRGCLAGPVFAAAVILPSDYQNKLLNDSKKLSASKRDKLRIVIENDALAYAIGICSPSEIDEINILNASFLAMHRAIDDLTTPPQLLLIDGNRFKPYNQIPHQCLIKGDARFMSIAAASILAKTYRDEYMVKLHQSFPNYHWENNKGYPTMAHKLAIKAYGLTNHHRKTFNSKIQLKLSI